MLASMFLDRCTRLTGLRLTRDGRRGFSGRVADKDVNIANNVFKLHDFAF